MKKIYVALFSFFVFGSSLYAQPKSCYLTYVDSNSSYILSTSGSYTGNHATISFSNIPKYDRVLSTSTTGYIINHLNYSFANGLYSYYGSEYVLSLDCSCPVGQKMLQDPLYSSVYTCGVPPPPTCTASQFLSADNTTCIDNTVQNQSSSGSVTEYEYLNGDYQLCDTASQTCQTFDKNGKTIANIPINGVTYNTINNTVTNKLLKVGGVVLGSVAGGIAIIGSVGTAGLAPAAAAAFASQTATYGTLSIGSFLGLSGSAYLSSSPYVENVQSSDNLASTANGIKVNLSQMDFSKESPNVSKSVDLATGATVSTLSQSDGTTTSVKEDTTNITVTETKPTGEVHEVVIPKSTLTTPPVTNDFTQQNNVQDFTYKETVTPAPKINNDGSVSTPAKQVLTHTLTSANKNTVTSTSNVANTATTTPTATNAPTQTTATTTDSTGVTSTTTTDSKAITDRINTLIRQTTKANGDRTTTNNLLSQIRNTNQGIQTDTHNMSTKLSDISTTLTQSDSKLSRMDTNLKKISDNSKTIDSKLQYANSDLDGIAKNTGDIRNSIADTGTSASLFSGMKQQFTDFKNNIASQYNTVLGQAQTLKGTIQGGFKNNLPTATVTTCPFIRNLDFVGKTIPLNIDVCKVLSPVYSTTYFIFYIVFFAGFTMITFNILIGTRSS